MKVHFVDGPASGSTEIVEGCPYEFVYTPATRIHTVGKPLTKEEIENIVPFERMYICEYRRCAITRSGTHVYEYMGMK